MSNKNLIISLLLYILIIITINISKPNNLYYISNNKKVPYSFGIGDNKKIVCLNSFYLILPMLIYLIIVLLY